MGIKVAGSLGNAQELEMSYKIFEKNVVKPERESLEEMFNELLGIAETKQSITIVNFQVIGEQIVAIEDEASKVTNALNSMSPLVATKVLENLTPNEIRALAALAPVAGGDVKKNPDGSIPTATPSIEDQALEQATNDALKGLDAKSNMDLMRIIRDHGKGKLNDALAIARLRAYGLTEDEAKDILDIQ